MTSAQATPAEAQTSLADDFFKGILHTILPDRLLGTLWRYLFDTDSFFSEALSGNWERKARPIQFFILAYALAVGLYAPVAKREQAANWTSHVALLAPEDKMAFAMALAPDSALVIAPVLDLYVSIHADEIAEQVHKAIGGEGSLTTDELVRYMDSTGQHTLALALREASNRDTGDGTPPEWALSLILLLFLISQWWLTYKFLGRRARTWNATLIVCLYNMAMFFTLVGIPMVLAQRVGQTWLAGFSVVAFILWFFRVIHIWRHVYGVGLWRLWWASFFASIVASPIGLIVFALAGGGKSG